MMRFHLDEEDIRDAYDSAQGILIGLLLGTVFWALFALAIFWWLELDPCVVLR